MENATHTTPTAHAPQRLALQVFDAPHDFVQVADAALAHWRFGSGPALLFVHGWPLHSATFRALLPALARHYTCHLLDLPGAGHTRAPAGAAADVTRFAELVRGAADALGLRRYALFAHDSGGAVARLVAAADPRVLGLVLGPTEIPGHHPRIIRALKAALRMPGGAWLVQQSLASPRVRRSRFGFGGCFRDPALIEGEFTRAFVEPLLAEPVRAASALAMLRRLDLAFFDGLADVHARIHVPTLLVWGDDDPIFPLPKLRAMLPQLVGGAELHVIPGGRTFVHEEQPEAFVAAALPFLARVLAAS